VAKSLARWAETALATAGAVAALVAFAVAPGTRTSTHDNGPLLPRTVATLAARSGGREIVLVLNYHGAWVNATGLLVQAERSRRPACVEPPYWSFMMTSQFICTPQQMAHGARFALDRPGSPGPVIARLRFAAVRAAAPVRGDAAR
jgi:hypothetical protein